MNNRQQYALADGKSYFRVESDGRIRLVLWPEDRVVLIGHWNEKEGVLLLYKSRSVFEKKSYTLAVPKELWTNLSNIKTVAIHTRDRNKYLATSASKLRMFGYDEEGSNESHGQRYLFLDNNHWDEVGGLDDVMEYAVDRKSLDKALKGGQDDETTGF